MLHEKQSRDSETGDPESKHMKQPRRQLHPPRRTMELRRYAITDLIDDLRDATDPLEQRLVAFALFERIAELMLLSERAGSARASICRVVFAYQMRRVRTPPPARLSTATSVRSPTEPRRNSTAPVGESKQGSSVESWSRSRGLPTAPLRASRRVGSRVSISTLQSQLAGHGAEDPQYVTAEQPVTPR